MEAQISSWAQELEALHQRIGGCFARSEQRQRSLSYLRGLLSPIERKNSWQLAEHGGETTPDGMQRLLNGAHWDANAVGDDLRSYVVEQLGDEAAVLVVDETGFLKKGTHSAGVARQYSGTAGRIENCQVGVFLVYSTAQNATFLDRELYLPKEWTQDRGRCQQAAVPASIGFATKPQLARQMLERALAAQVPFAWVTGDSIYGGDRKLRLFLEAQGCSFVLGVPCNEALWAMTERGPRQVKAQTLMQQGPHDAWQGLSAGEGAKGPRLYDWALVELYRYQPTAEDQAWGHWLLVRRSVSDPQELAYYVVFAPRTTTLEEMVRVAGTRWRIESCFEVAKGQLGLDQYEVRRYDAWYRHITLSLLAHALLCVIRTRQHPTPHQRAQDVEKGGVVEALKTSCP
jgi:SRSO17 transposase